MQLRFKCTKCQSLHGPGVFGSVHWIPMRTVIDELLTRLGGEWFHYLLVACSVIVSVVAVLLAYRL